MALTTAICLPRFAQAYDFVGSYILGIGRGYRDTRHSRLRIMGKPVLPLLTGLALLHSSSCDRPRSSLCTRPCIYATLITEADGVNSPYTRVPRVGAGDTVLACVRDCQCG